MPKKRFTSQYSKPQSTVHPSLSSGASSSTSRNDARPSVNELIFSLRKSQISSEQREQRGTSPTVTPTLPPQIRQILSQPETPTPKSRIPDRRRFYADGRRTPSGPPPPRSWLEGSRQVPKGNKGVRLYPDDVNHLPGLEERPGRRRLAGGHALGQNKNGRSLQDMCLRRMAIDWEFVREWERNNLADLPTRLRMLLLRNIAVYGPEDGIGFEGLKSVIMLPEEDTTEPGCCDINGEFYQLDLSGSVGRSVSFKQLTELVENPIQQAVAEDNSWEDTIMSPLSPRIPYLTHLSISHPPTTISWPKFLQFAKYIPTLTHLSLAHWPVPSLTPNSKTTVMSSKYAKDVQYGATNYYSHSLDHDFREAASILRRLASTLYGLEYLDVSGCTEWARALLWKGDGELGIDWSTQWMKMSTVKLLSDIHLTPKSEMWEISRYVMAFKDVGLVRLMMSKERHGMGKSGWIEIVRDDFREYEGLWKGMGAEEDDKRKRRALDQLKDWKEKEQHYHDTVLATENEIVARSIWDQ